MSLRIAAVHVTTEASSGPYTDLIVDNFNRAKAATTVVEHRYVKHLRRATDTVLPYPTLLNKIDVIDEVVAAERAGCQAVTVACSGDPGVLEARTAVSIPVIGSMEAALFLACSYGYRVGIVTVSDRTWVAFNNSYVGALGLSDRFAGVRSLHTPTQTIFTKGFEDPEFVADDIRARAAELVDDGADSVVIGSAGLSTFATAAKLAEVNGAPIFDCLVIGLKAAEVRAELTAQLGLPGSSRAGWTAALAEGDFERVNRTFGRQRL